MADYNAEMGTWNARDCEIIVDGINMFGFQDGDMVSGEFNNPHETMAIDPKGDGGFVENNDDSGKITINLAAISPCVDKLMDIVNAHKEVVISVTMGNEYIGGQQCRFEKDPGMTVGKTMPNFAFVADVVHLVHTRTAA